MFTPTTFGKYFLTRRIAVGGMAEVFLAKLGNTDGFEKKVVIKQILPQHARHPEFVQSFVREAKIAASLAHPNIVSIYELGRVQGTYFIAMEFVDGLNAHELSQRCHRQDIQVPIPLALRIVEEVCRGLAYAHARVGPDGTPLGLVHRDLSPRNVLVSREGGVKILDFGIAKTKKELPLGPEKMAEMIKGTSGYMSPEQAAGKEVDQRTDLYQAGLLLHELLTGEPLFWREDKATTRELMQQHRLVRPSTLRDDLPIGLDDLVVALLAREPEHRPSSADWVATQLEQLRTPSGRRGELAQFVGSLDHEGSPSSDIFSNYTTPATQ